MANLILILASLAQVQNPPQQLPASPVQRIVVSPSPATMIAQDTLRLHAQALDANGRPVPDVVFRFLPSSGARFEGTVTQDGLVRSGATGTLPVTIVANLTGYAEARERVEVKMVPAAAGRIEIVQTAGKLLVGQQVQLAARVYSIHGEPRTDAVVWRTSSASASVTDGKLTGARPGRVTVTATVGSASANFDIDVVANTINTLRLTPSASAARTGDVIRFQLEARDRANARITGLTPTYSFFPGHGAIDEDGAFVGYEAGIYTVFAHLGERTASATIRLANRAVRRPAEVVGRLGRMLFNTEEVWLHPNGKNLYLGTGRGGDRMYTVDISDPTKPFVTDSLVANTRRVNDIMTTPDGKFMVHTREGAADRRNGIVIASLEDPAHPKVIAEFTEGVAAGVHSAFIYKQEKFGTHIYLTNNGTSALHIIDINDPYNPREVGRWRSNSPFGGGSLHDIDVQDGIVYASNWNEGLVILDVGNGVKGGSPSNPQLITQFKFDLNDMYRDVEASGGPGFIRGTHTAWRHKQYVFIADEVFPAEGVKGAKGAAANRAYGRLQVIDVSNMDRPKSVAWYEPEYGGVHNVWVAGDTLYVGAYDAGFRAFDISGELRGDLRAQQREIVHVNTADLDAVPSSVNEANTWGVVVRDGLAYVNDNHNGLWIIRILPKRATTKPVT
ncbi:MAG: hypothetical protein ACRENP_25025 [Longimicrobiales bacterium]